MLKLVPCLAMLVAQPALASSDEAWAAFRGTVQAKCTALAQIPEGATLGIEVNPFGLDRYGVALLTVRLRDGTAERSGCILDKQTLDAEITAPFDGSDWPSGK